MEKIKYKEISIGDYHYELTEKYTCKNSLPKNITAKIPGYILIKNGYTTINIKYRWDGATGINRIYPNKLVLRASLAHDAGYQCIREGKLDKKYRSNLDDDLQDDFIEDGMPIGLAQASVLVVRGIGWVFI
jgi:hypothetical protein